MKSNILLGFLGSLVICAPIVAQQPPDNGGGWGGGPGGGPNGGPDRQGQRDEGPPHHPPGIGPMLNRLKNDLHASDDQWTAMSPKLQAILQLEHELYSGQGGPPHGGPNGGGPDGGPNGGGPDGGPHGGGGGGGAGGPPDGPDGNGGGGPHDGDSATTRPTVNAQADALHKAKHDLGQLINESDAPADDLKPVLQSLRDARAAAKTALTTAQHELKPLVNAKQEAMLVAFGILE